ncbi:MAG: hypothetical protein J0H79_14080 [Alphaproteobacteria bacterium]|nr:hypothetical protein [Alphaproteobacteria bacterium]
MPETKDPRRRIVMCAKIDADSWDDLYNHLRNLVAGIARDGKRLSKSSVSGGYSSGHIIVVSEDETVTHDKWAAELDAWLEAHR